MVVGDVLTTPSAQCSRYPLSDIPPLPSLETSHSPFSVPLRPWAFGAAVLLDPYSVNSLTLDGIFGSHSVLPSSDSLPYPTS